MPKDDPLQIDIEEGRNPGTRILRLTGPVTLANLFALQDALRGGQQAPVTILELCGVLYMDSAGMGAVINYFTHCQRNGNRLLVAGVSPRVRELFKMTRVDTIIPMLETVDEAEAQV
ncbi:MAG TPA: STAS domain-containing protein [Terracidiphilus sp.]|jgi:anti-sigma B factor antagonist|nr:STAS domain-containing protein [Terracidiphilus sp.]